MPDEAMNGSTFLQGAVSGAPIPTETATKLCTAESALIKIKGTRAGQKCSLRDPGQIITIPNPESRPTLVYSQQEPE